MDRYLLTESNNYIAASACRISSYAVCSLHTRTAVDCPISLSYPVESIRNGLNNGQKCHFGHEEEDLLTNAGADKWISRPGAAESKQRLLLDEIIEGLIGGIGLIMHRANNRR